MRADPATVPPAENDRPAAPYWSGAIGITAALGAVKRGADGKPAGKLIRGRFPAALSPGVRC